MTTIVLDATNWRSEKHFYAAYCNATRAPDWFGRNLDAFLDSLRGGICKITPEKIVIKNLKPKVKELIGYKFWNSIEEICQEQDVELEVNPP